MEKLYNNQDLINDDGKIVANEFKLLIEEFLQRTTKKYSTIELRFLLTDEIDLKLAEIRIIKNSNH